jgi:hypothetical protein
VANAAASAALQRQIDALRNLPGKLQTEAAGIAMAVLDRAITADIAAGKDPDGKPWKKTKEGATPLRGARKALSFRRVGTGVLVQLNGPEALHHLGKAKGEVVRRIIPVGRLSSRYAAALRAALGKRFTELASSKDG